MMDLSLHHVTVPTRDLDRAAQFYEGVLGLGRIPRPPFPNAGIWYGVGDRQIHITVHPDANFRASKPVDNDDIHFALRVEDFEEWCVRLKDLGYDESLPNNHPKKLIVKRSGAAGFPQVFLMDPDLNVIELNNAPFLR